MIKKIVGVALISAALMSAPSAQNTAGDPNFGTVSLSSGFQPDPTTISVISGGSIDSSNLLKGSTSCNGYISNAPDVRLNFSAGSGSLPLIISANASEDTTLIVNAPDGNWYCNDDGGNGLNPSVRFNNPQSGRYEVWIGTYGANSNYSAVLHISELSSQ